MDWTTLISVVIGGLIATIPILVSNRFQATEREKEREEQRKEAKAQLALELMRNDIKVIEEVIDGELNTLDVMSSLNLEMRMQDLSDDEIRDKTQKELFFVESKHNKLNGVALIADKIVSTFGDEFSSAYDTFCELSTEYSKKYIEFSSEEFPGGIDDSELLTEITRVAGKLHTMMREKLISIRETAWR